MSNSALADTTGLMAGPVQQLVEMGGPVMVVLLFLALAGLATFVYLMLCGALYAPRLTRTMKKAITRWQQSADHHLVDNLKQQAGRFARLNPLHHLVTDTMEARLEHRDPQQVRESVARDAQHALEPFEAPLKIIEVIAALAPLLGLLGTVLGMMEAFSAMAATEGRANASQLSGGIYEALTTTAAGLVVAIPFAALAAWVEFRLRRIHKTINSVMVTVLAVPVPAHTAIKTAADRAHRVTEPAASEHALRGRTREATTDETRAQVAHATG